MDGLEKLEGIKLDSFDIGNDRLKILQVFPVEGRELLDIGIPELSRVLMRRQDLGAIISALDIHSFPWTRLVPAAVGLGEMMKFEAFDILTHVKEYEAEHARPTVSTPQEVIGFYAEEIGRRIKAPGQFAAIAIKLREFFNERAFGEPVNLDAPGYLQAMAGKFAGEQVLSAFMNAIRPHIIEEQAPQVITPARSLYTTPPFPWSRPVYEATRSIFNLQACDNEYERRFAEWLDHATDCRTMAKLPRDFGFAIEYADVAGNLRLYYPDFVAVDTSGGYWLIETKGQEDLNVTLKDRAAELWCKNATALAVGKWQYVKVRDKDFESFQPSRISQLQAMGQLAFAPVSN